MTIADTELVAITGESAAGAAALVRLEQLAVELLSAAVETLPCSASALPREVYVVVID